MKRRKEVQSHHRWSQLIVKGGQTGQWSEEESEIVELFVNWWLQLTSRVDIYIYPIGSSPEWWQARDSAGYLANQVHGMTDPGISRSPHFYSETWNKDEAKSNNTEWNIFYLFEIIKVKWMCFITGTCKSPSFTAKLFCHSLDNNQWDSAYKQHCFYCEEVTAEEWSHQTTRFCQICRL